jgi:hypothetical protein
MPSVLLTHQTRTEATIAASTFAAVMAVDNRQPGIDSALTTGCAP